jgi:hypothetical protein
MGNFPFFLGIVVSSRRARMVSSDDKWIQALTIINGRPVGLP